MTLPGNRKILPTPGFQRVTSDAQLAGLELEDGQALPVSNADEARLRYNNATENFEASLDAAAYVEVAVAGSALCPFIDNAGVIEPVTASNDLALGDGVRATAGDFRTDETFSWQWWNALDAGNRIALEIVGREARFGSRAQGMRTCSPERVVCVPFGPGIDDWAQLFAVLSAEAYQRTVVMAAGTWLCQTQQRIPAGTHLVMEPGVRIVSSLTPAPIQFVFNGSYILTGVGDTTLAAVPVIGARTISTVGAVPVGTWIMIHNSTVPPNFRRQFYQVIGTAGVGPFTLTLSRPLLMTFAVGDEVCPATDLCRDVLIEGNGAIISGTGARAWNVTGAQNVILRDLHVEGVAGAWGSVGISWDEGCYDCHSFDCSVYSSDGTAFIDGGFGVEGASEFCSHTRAIAIGTNGPGALLNDSECCWYAEPQIECCGPGLPGISVGASDPTQGNRDGLIVGGMVVGSLLTAIEVNSGAKRTSIVGVHINGGQDGVLVTGASDLTRIERCHIESTTRSSVYVNAGTTRTRIRALHENNNVGGIYCLADCKVWALDSYNDGYALRNQGSGSVELDGFDVVGTASYLLGSLGTGPTSLRNGRVTTAAGQNAIWQWGANVLTRQNVKTYAPGGGIGLYVDGANGTVIDRDDVDDTGATIPIYLSGATSKIWRDGAPETVTFAAGATAAQLNWGTLVANGAAAVVVPSVWVATNRKLSLGLNTIGGAPAGQPFESAARVAATSFTVAAAAGDTSTYNWKLVE